MNNIELSIKGLLETKPFYAHFFLNSKIVYDHPKVPTAAVALTREGVVLYFNRTFLSPMTGAQVQAIIEHEVLHILFEHISAMTDKTLSPQLANISMDVAINQYITGLPDGCLTLEGVNKMAALNMEAKQTWEYYYSKLLASGNGMEGTEPHDCHGIQSEKDAPPSDLGKAILKKIIDTAIKGAAGNVPEEVLKVYESLKHEAQVPWKQVLSNFISSCVSSTTQATRKKTNRRYGLDFPGRKKKRELVLGVCIDSSGSVSDDSYDMFMAEVVRISGIASKIHIIEADCVVQNIETIKKNKKVPLKRQGCGGTAYQPAIDACMKLGCDAIIYFGDFDTSDTPKNPGVPFLWVGVGSSPKPGNFGSEIRLK
jgi:predicted metal-dependent peptidase